MERHNKTGRMAVNTMTSLNALAQNAPKASSTPTRSAPTPGVLSDFAPSQGTGGGTAAQLSSEMKFSKDAA